MKDIISSLGYFLRAMVEFFDKMRGKLFKDKKDFVKFIMIWTTALFLWWIIKPIIDKHYSSLPWYVNFIFAIIIGTVVLTLIFLIIEYYIKKYDEMYPWYLVTIQLYGTERELNMIKGKEELKEFIDWYNTDNSIYQKDSINIDHNMLGFLVSFKGQNDNKAIEDKKNELKKEFGETFIRIRKDQIIELNYKEIPKLKRLFSGWIHFFKFPVGNLARAYFQVLAFVGLLTSIGTAAYMLYKNIPIKEFVDSKYKTVIKAFSTFNDLTLWLMLLIFIFFTFKAFANSPSKYSVSTYIKPASFKLSHSLGFNAALVAFIGWSFNSLAKIIIA